MKEQIEKYLDFHKNKGGSGKIFNFKLIEYRKGFLKLRGSFPANTLNPAGTVQGGQMNSMLDDVTSLLLIYEAGGTIYPNSTNLHSIHHRPLFEGDAIGTAEIIKKGEKIVTMKGQLYNLDGKLVATLIHTAMIMEFKK